MVQLYFLSRTTLQKLLMLLEACFTGFWLGVLHRQTFYAIDQRYYDGQPMYHTATYNRRGLWPWEKQMMADYFQGRHRLLVAGAGGGREVLALRQAGYVVDGFECHPGLVDFANGLLAEEGYAPTVILARRDHCPEGAAHYDGIIIGWGAYMLIQGKAQRVAFLRQLRQQVAPSAPLLLSFYSREQDSQRFQVVMRIGNLFRRLLHRERLELGDSLAPNFVHYFTQEQIRAEMQAGGFSLIYYGTASYGHAVGIAMEGATTAGACKEQILQRQQVAVLS